MDASFSINPHPFLAGGGESGKLIRGFDWATAPLGTPDKWPLGLLMSVSHLLRVDLPMLVLWGDEQICFYNDAASLSLTANTLPAIGKPAKELEIPAWAVMSLLLDQVVKTGEPLTCTDVPLTVYHNGHSEAVYWTVSFSQLLNDQGQPGGVLILAVDGTQQVLARQQLEAEKQQGDRQLRLYETMASSTPDLFYVFDLNYRFIYVNQALMTMWGSTWEQSIGKGLLENGYEPWHAQMHEREIDQVVATKQPIRGEVAFPHATLGKRIYDYVFAPILNEVGEVEAIAGTTRDISEMKAALLASHESEARFRTMAEGTSVLILVEDPTGQASYVNTAWTQLTGRSMEELLGLAWIELIHPNDQPRYWSSYGDAFSAHGPFTGEFRVLNQAGDYRWLLIEGVARFQADNAFSGYILSSVDITEQKMSHLALQEAESGLRGAVEMAQLGTWSIDVATGGLTYSDRLIDWFGYDPGAQDYTQVIPILSAEDQERVAAAVAQALMPRSDGVYEETYTVIHPQTGQKRVLHAQGKTVFDASGKAIRLNGTARDITLQRARQTALEQQVQERTDELATINEELAATNEELAATNEEYAALNADLEEANALLRRSNTNLQTFAYVASHDLQEPLRKIQQFGDLLQARQASRSGDEQIYIERMQSAASRMSTLIRDLLNFSRLSTQQEAFRPVPLNEVVDHCLTTLELVIGETNAQVEVSHLPTVEGDTTQLAMLFQNLLANALKFRMTDATGVPVAPVIRLNAHQLFPDQLPAMVKPARAAPAYHRIDVIDNGIGFDEKYLDRIFQVFQRLHGKHAFTGTGIGLAICERVVTNHGGAITARSQPGQGATFSVYLPI